MIRELPTSLTRQRGISLIMAMIMLVGLMLGSVALFRSVDTATLVAGNMAYKHAASLSGERGVQAALAWLNAQPQTTRHNNQAVAGYCATHHQLDLDPAGWDPRIVWTACAGVNPVSLPVDLASNRVEYLIHRLCNSAGAPDNPNQCSMPVLAETSSTEGQSKRSAAAAPPPVPPAVAYRISVRVLATNGSSSFIQSTVVIQE